MSTVKPFEEEAKAVFNAAIMGDDSGVRIDIAEALREAARRLPRRNEGVPSSSPNAPPCESSPSPLGHIRAKDLLALADAFDACVKSGYDSFS
jgi:hypothetical protein